MITFRDGNGSGAGCENIEVVIVGASHHASSHARVACLRHSFIAQNHVKVQRISQRAQHCCSAVPNTSVSNTHARDRAAVHCRQMRLIPFS